MELSVIKKAEKLEVKVIGTNKIYVLNQESIRDEITWLLSIDHKQIIFDMHNIRFIDATGIKLLLELNSKYKALNRKLTLKNVSQNVKKIVAMMGMETVFSFEKSEELELIAA